MTSADLFGSGRVLGATRNRDRERVIVTQPGDFPWPWRRRPADRDRSLTLSAGLLAGACILLAVLAAMMGVVSWHAQYAFVLAAKHQHLASALEALGLDAGAVIFAVLGIALARLGRRAVIERTLVCLCALGSCSMNLAGADLGSPRSAAVFAMPPLLFAAGSDRLVAVIRRAALGPREDDEARHSAWRLAGTAALYLLRLAIAPPSTMAGARRALLNATPLPAPAAPGPPGAIAAAVPAACAGCGAAACAACGGCSCEPGWCRCPDRCTCAGSRPRERSRRAEPGERREGTKTARFISLVEQRHGPLADFDLANVSRVAGELAPQADLHAGSARSALRAAALAARTGPVRDAREQLSPLADGRAAAREDSAPRAAVVSREASRQPQSAGTTAGAGTADREAEAAQ
jgi:hypothetical protein